MEVVEFKQFYVENKDILSIKKNDSSNGLILRGNKIGKTTLHLAHRVARHIQLKKVDVHVTSQKYEDFYSKSDRPRP